MIVPARDAARTLPRLLAGLGSLPAGSAYEVIVVDNGSTDETAPIAEGSPVVARVVRRARGEGPGAARNAGAEAARAPSLAFLDADCWPAPGWLAAGVAALERVDLVQGRVLPDPLADLGPFDRTLSVGGAHGLFESANLFVRREVFERVGGFPGGLEATRSGPGRAGEPFGEDVVFGWRARRSGATTSFCAEALAYHEVTNRDALEFIAERKRLGLFPQLAALVPELRDSFFYRRVFHTRRSAAFDLAFLGIAVGVARRDPRALLGAGPYAGLVATSARRWGRRAPLVALAEAAADAVGAAALVRGSLSARTLLL